MPDDDLDQIVDRLMPRLLPEFRSLARRLIEAGIQVERHRVIALIQTPNVASASHPQNPLPAYPAAHGSISGPVLAALQALAPDLAGGIGAADLALYFERRGGGPTDRQARAAIKQLTNTGEAICVARGRYLPRAAASTALTTEGENPDGDASGDFQQAAE